MVHSSWLKARGSRLRKNWRWVPQALAPIFFGHEPWATSLEAWAMSFEPLNHEMIFDLLNLRDSATLRPRNQETKTPRNQQNNKNKKPRKQETNTPRNQETYPPTLNIPTPTPAPAPLFGTRGNLGDTSEHPIPILVNDPSTFLDMFWWIWMISVWFEGPNSK